MASKHSVYSELHAHSCHTHSIAISIIIFLVVFKLFSQVLRSSAKLLNTLVFLDKRLIFKWFCSLAIDIAMDKMHFNANTLRSVKLNTRKKFKTVK